MVIPYLNFFYPLPCLLSSSVCLSDSWICTYLKAGLWVCPCVCVCVFPCVCPPQRALLSLLLNNTESITWGRNEEYFPEISNRVLQGIKSLTPTDPNRVRWQTSKHYQALSEFLFQHLWEIFIRLPLSSICCFQQMCVIIRVQTHVHYFWVRGII